MLAETESKPLSDIRAVNESAQPQSVATSIDAFLFYSLLAVIALAAIPYGTVEPWWKALFQCLVFVLAGLTLIQRTLRGQASGLNSRVYLPVLALIIFGLIQTIASPGTAGTQNVTKTLSADVFQTRLFAIQLAALLLVSWMLAIHTSSRRRLRLLVDLIIAIAVVSAIFGIVRQVSQHEPGFLLPYLRPGFGYAQFINSNHFAFLMEMALGLALGIAVCRGVTGRRLAIYLLGAIPMWVALILCGSRGGILSILCQVFFLALLFGTRRESKYVDQPRESWLSNTRMIAVRLVLIAAMLSAAVATVIFVGGDPLASKLDSVSVELNRKTADTFVLRPNIWRASWELIKDHPIAGVGFGAYRIAITKYHRGSGEATPQEAHNDYLDLLAGGGVIALAIVIWFGVEVFLAGRRKLRQADNYHRAVTLGAVAGILTVSIHSLVDFGLHITINAVVFTALLTIVSFDLGATSVARQSRP